MKVNQTILFCFRTWLTIDQPNVRTATAENEGQSQPARDVPGTSLEGPLKFVTSGTSRGPLGDS